MNKTIAFAVEMAACTALALAPAGPGEFRLETGSDVSYVEEGFAVPDHAALTVRPGVFCPEGGPVGVDEVVWRNVKLSDIAGFTGKISNVNNGTYFWEDATCNNVVTNAADGYVQCQLQFKNGSTLYGFVMQYRQEGDDVKARIAMAKYSSGSDIGADLTGVGAAFTVTNSPYAVEYKVRALADLGFVLREGADAVAAPSEIVLASTDASAAEEETYRHLPCLTTEQATLCRNLRIGDIVGISGEISHEAINHGAWTEVRGYVLTNIADAVQMNLMYKTGTRRLGASIRFYQAGRDVRTCTYWAGHAYDNGELDSPFGEGVKGVSLGVTDEPGTASIAVRNLKVRFRPSTRIVADFEPCIVKEDGESGWVIIWEDVRLADATFGPALMGGASLDAKWNVASNYLRTAQTYTTQSYYQRLKGNTLYSIRFLMQQQFGDVYAKLASARYNWSSAGDLRPGYDPGTSDTSNTAVTNVVDAAIPGMAHTLAICGLVADVPAKRRHSVAVGADFDPGPSPVRLADVKLALAPSAQESMIWSWDVRGCGAIGVSGAGSVALGADLRDNIGLDVDSGTAVISSSRTVAGPVNVKSGARLEFVIATGVRPALAAPSFFLEPGSEVVISSTSFVSDVPDGGDAFKIVTGCGYADDALDGVTCRVAGDFLSTAALSVDGDGDIVATVRSRKGTVFVFR